MHAYDHSGSARGHKRRVAHEVNGIPKTLLGKQQNILVLQRFGAEPSGATEHRPAPRRRISSSAIHIVASRSGRRQAEVHEALIVVRFGALRIDGNGGGKAFERVLMAVERNQSGALIDVEFDNAGSGGKRSFVTGHGFGWAVEPSQKTTAFVQRVNVVRPKRKNHFVGGQRLIKPLQTLERAGSASKRGKIVRASASASSKQRSAY